MNKKPSPIEIRPPTDREYCEMVMVGARRCGMGMLAETKDGKTKYSFVDIQFRAIIHGEEIEDKQKALKSACEKLSEFFRVK